MKYVKILGLAAVAAAALMAFVGAGTASAQNGEKTALCKVTPTNGICALENTYPAGTVVESEATETATLTPSGELPTITCTSSKLSGKTETETTPEGKITELTWGGCNQTVETKENGKLIIHHDGEHNGTITAEGVSVTVSALFGSLHCDFGGTIKEGLTLTGGNPAIVDATATVKLVKQTGFFTCPGTAVWHAKYKVTSPTPLYVGTHA
jgi:hypothetical protein